MSKLYHITLTVRPYKNITSLDGEKIIYKRASPLEQHCFIDEQTSKVFNGCPYTLISEEHKNKSLHYHGMILCRPVQYEIFNAQLNSYFGNTIMGELYTDIDCIRWNKYIRKEAQGMIIESGHNGITWSEFYKLHSRPSRPLIQE